MFTRLQILTAAAGLAAAWFGPGRTLGEEANQSAPRPRAPMIHWEKKKLADNYCEACELADVNRDGKLDVISGPAWYKATTSNRIRSAR